MPVLGRGGSSPPSRTRISGSHTLCGAPNPSGDKFTRLLSVDIDIIEQMFEYGSMSPVLTLSPHGEHRRVQLDTLRRTIRTLEAPQLDHPVLPTLSGLERLFPHGGLRRGAVYELSSHQSLLWLLTAGVTAGGHFAALVGLSNVGLRSAHDLGVDLDRLVLLSHPGNHWWSATNTLADALSLVAVRPGTVLPSVSQRNRFAARLRERGTTVLVCGRWPGAEATLSVERAHWEGLGHGAGVLQRQTLTCRHQARRDPVPRRVEVSISAEGIRISALRVRPSTLSTLQPIRASRTVPAYLERQAG